jgi:glutamate carboxypeptidase
VLINPDEEIGSPGSAALLAEAAKRNHLGLLFEPAMGAGPTAALASHRRGSGVFTLVVHGRAAHAGRDFEQGRSAVVALAVLIIQMHALNNVVEGVTVNVGRIEGGAAVNVVPDLAIARVNVRTTELADEKTIRGHLDDLVTRANGKDGIRVQLHGGFTSPPKPLDDRMRTLMQAVTACGNDLGLRLEWRLSGGVSDGNKLAAAGLPTVDSLGPRGDRIHSAEEFIQLDSLVERAQLSALLLMKLASGELIWPPAVQ